jgi:protein-disulfide isomerase
MRLLRLLLTVGIITVLAASIVLASNKKKVFPWVRVVDVNVSDYKKEFVQEVEKMLGEVPSYGRCQESVASCLEKNPPHKTAQRLARDVFTLMLAKEKKEKILEWVKTRKKMAHPERVIDFRLGGVEPLGDKDAPVVIVEFSDFECPFCAIVAPRLKKLVEESKQKACLYFKQFPLKSHPRALEASKAAVAAEKFGKFWEYSSKLFENRKDLSDEKLLEIAKEVGIKVEDFQKEMKRAEVLNRIADDKMEGLMYRIKGTPAVYINGKEVIAEPTLALLKDRIEEELDIKSKKD